MAPDTQTQVDELLADLAAVFDDASTAADGQPDPEALNELADRADELVAVTELSDLLVASGLSDEDEPPASLPAAVASGDPENVARLRSLLTASKVPRADDDQRAALVDELQSLVETAREAPSTETETTSDATETEAASTSDAAEPTETEAEDDEESTAPIRELLQSQLEDTEGVFDEVPDIETLSGGLGEDEGDRKTATADEDESREDQSTRSRDGTRWRPGGGRQRTTHSTIPSTGRRDIGRRPGRFSSVRGSTVSKR